MWQSACEFRRVQLDPAGVAEEVVKDLAQATGLSVNGVQAVREALVRRVVRVEIGWSSCSIRGRLTSHR